MTEISQLEQMDKRFDEIRVENHRLKKIVNEFLNCRSVSGQVLEPLYEKAHTRAVKFLKMDIKTVMNGQKLRSLRVNADMTQLELANRMHLNVSTIWRWEKGPESIPPHRQKQLEEIFKED